MEYLVKKLSACSHPENDSISVAYPVPKVSTRDNPYLFSSAVSESLVNRY